MLTKSFGIRISGSGNDASATPLLRHQRPSSEGQPKKSDDELAKEVDQFMEATDCAAQYGSASASSCPYHSEKLLPKLNGLHQEGKRPNPVDRYLSQDPGEEPSLFRGADGSPLSTSKNCTCWIVIGM
jgi:hypothetical protein